MKYLYNLMCVIFCIITFGFCNIYVKYSDGTKFKWVGWVKRIQDKQQD